MRTRERIEEATSNLRKAIPGAYRKLTEDIGACSGQRSDVARLAEQLDVRRNVLEGHKRAFRELKMSIDRDVRRN